MSGGNLEAWRGPRTLSPVTTANTDDVDVPDDDPSSDGRRTAALEVTDGGLVVYDPRQHTAWLQSDAPVDVTTRC
jgi:hypothetical protein